MYKKLIIYIYFIVRGYMKSIHTQINKYLHQILQIKCFRHPGSYVLYREVKRQTEIVISACICISFEWIVGRDVLGVWSESVHDEHVDSPYTLHPTLSYK